MVSYFKTQCVNIILGLFNIGYAIYLFCTGDDLWGVAWCLAAVVWLLMSFINYNDDRIKLLEKKAEKYDALCEEVKALYQAYEVNKEINRYGNQI